MLDLLAAAALSDVTMVEASSEAAVRAQLTTTAVEVPAIIAITATVPMADRDTKMGIIAPK